MSEPGELTLSWSALRQHEECRAKNHLLRTGKTPDFNIRSYFHGTVVDLVMRTWLRNDPQPGEMQDMVEDLMRQAELDALKTGDGVVKWKSPTDRDEMLRWCITLVNRLEPILLERCVPYPYDPARRFRVPVTIPYLSGAPTRIWLAGEIDLMVRPDGYHLWDLKGTQNNSYWRSVYGQIIFYHMAMEIMYGEPPKLAGLIQPMCDERVKPLPVTADHVTAMWSRIIRMASDMWAHDNMHRADSKYCYNCPVKSKCPKFAPVDPAAEVKRVSWGVQRGSVEPKTSNLVTAELLIDGTGGGDGDNVYNV